MKKDTKTNAARLLDNAGISYDLNPYEVDEGDLSAVHVAELLGLDSNLLFSTLVLRGDRSGVFVCLIPGNERLDLKKAARESGNKKVDLVPMKELLSLTGYIRGGCSPIGMKKHYPTYIDTHILNKAIVYVSAGVRGLQIKIDSNELIRFVDAKVVDIVL